MAFDKLLDRRPRLRRVETYMDVVRMAFQMSNDMTRASEEAFNFSFELTDIQRVCAVSALVVVTEDVLDLVVSE